MTCTLKSVHSAPLYVSISNYFEILRGICAASVINFTTLQLVVTETMYNRLIIRVAVSQNVLRTYRCSSRHGYDFTLEPEVRCTSVCIGDVRVPS